MFFEKEYKYNIIEDVDIKIIENALERNNVHLSIIDNSTEWCAFAHYYGLKNGFNSIHCVSFAYMISLFMTGMGISAGSDMYIKESTLEMDLVDKYQEIMSADGSEKSKVKSMFNCIFELYKNDIHMYEYCTDRINFKVTPTEKQMFLDVTGNTGREKLIWLMKNNTKK